ncbi:AbgT family transporter [Bacteroidales bacterium OttesenSCG-928-I21]|nr:AbgT family transporter [Bacteroidales bacterium OttesenSCG-928-I21]
MLKKVPHTYVIVFSIVVVAAMLTWFIPAGEFDRTVKTMEDGRERTVIVDNSFHNVDPEPQTWQIFTSIFDGFVAQSHIIVFILLIGGAFWILNASKALDVGILAFLKATKSLERNKFLKKIGVENIVMILIMTLFSLFGAIFGMSEETIAFVIILVPLAISMGYDSITGVCLVYVAAHLGFAGAILNPFTIGIAQGLSDLPVFSGWEYRIFCWVIINFVGFGFILLYARKIKKNPKKSLTYNIDEYWRRNQINNEEKLKYYTPKSAWLSFILVSIVLILFSIAHPNSTLKVGNSQFNFYAIPVATSLFVIISFFTLRKSVHFYILNLLAFTIVFLIIGVMGYDWYVMEIGGLFFGMGLASGVAMNKSANEITKLFIEGAKDIFSAAFIVGIAGGIIIILTDGKIVDTIMYGLSKSMQSFSKEGSLGIMYSIQTFLNIIIPSGSAKAALTMPIMAPFSDLIEISRQSTVLAFQFGDGFTNMITPTSGVLIGCLGIAKIPYNIWFKFVWKLILLLVALGFLLLLPSLYLNLNGF